MYTKAAYIAALPMILFISAAIASELTVHSMVDKSEIYIGDKISYRITVRYPETGTIELPSVLGNLGSFEVKKYDVSQPMEVKGGREQTWEFIISTFTVGQYTLPPQVVEFTPEHDTVQQSLYTEPIVINVLRTSPETVKDIAGITALADIRRGGGGLWIAIVLTLAVAGGILLMMYRTRQKAKKREPPPKPPYEEAMALLDSLRGKNLPASGAYKEYCFALSEILRRYLTRRFTIDALESTTEEFLEKIKEIDLTAAQRDITAQFCARTDPVKFADFTLTEEECVSVFDWVRTIVEQTRPRLVEGENNTSIERSGHSSPHRHRQNGD